MIKLISIDMDGTLLDNQGNLPPGNIPAIKAAREKGIHVILNTGKPLSALLDAYQVLGLDDPVITLTGGAILEKNADDHWQMVMGNPLPSSSFERIYRRIQDIPVSTYLMNNNITYIYHFTDDPEYVRRFSEAMEKFSDLNYSIVSNSPLIEWSSLDMPAYKIMFFGETYDTIALACRTLNETEIPEIVSEFSSPWTVDVRTVDAGKKNMVEFLCNLYQIDRTEVMALGDHESDIELIQWAGVGALMENGNDDLKKDAPIIAPSNEACGVARIIEEYAL